jgi:hypothetical protein
MERNPNNQPNLLFTLYLSKSAEGVPAPAFVTVEQVFEGVTAKEIVIGEPVVFLKEVYGFKLDEISKVNPDNTPFKAVLKVVEV